MELPAAESRKANGVIQSKSQGLRTSREPMGVILNPKPNSSVPGDRGRNKCDSRSLRPKSPGAPGSKGRKR